MDKASLSCHNLMFKVKVTVPGVLYIHLNYDISQTKGFNFDTALKKSVTGKYVRFNLHVKE